MCLFLEAMIVNAVNCLMEAARARGLGSAIALLPDEEYYDPALCRTAADLPEEVAFGTHPNWFGLTGDSDATAACVWRWSERTVTATD